MPKKGPTEEQIIAALKQYEAKEHPLTPALGIGNIVME